MKRSIVFGLIQDCLSCIENMLTRLELEGFMIIIDMEWELERMISRPKNNLLDLSLEEHYNFYYKQRIR